MFPDLPAPPEIYHVEDGVTAPLAMDHVDPEYDEADRKAKTQGTVRLVFIVTPDGVPESIRIVRSLSLGLDKQAIEAVSRWKFAPNQDGKPVAVWIGAEVTFKLK